MRRIVLLLALNLLAGLPAARAAWYEREEAIMGTRIAVQLWSEDPVLAVNAIDAVMAGSILMSPGVAGKLMETLSDSNPVIRRRIREELPFWYRELRSRDRHILKLMLQGFSNREIADLIHVAPQTIRNYISQIYSTLEVENRSDALAKARSIDSFYYE